MADSGMHQPRCEWCLGDELMIAYHDTEWGVPLHDDQRHFEFLVLDGAQAGLSWRTILHKREGYRRCFAGFDPKLVASFTQDDIERILLDPGIVRNRLKVQGAVKNARAFLAVQQEFGSFDAYIWQFVDGAPIVNSYASSKDLPATSRQSDAMSKDMRRRGFTFVGSTICYAYMQAAGMVNDHIVTCHRRTLLR
jgi:DNA-3-methyladenine glycosylase I